jgi:hypothetical protein
MQEHYMIASGHIRQAYSDKALRRGEKDGSLGSVPQFKLKIRLPMAAYTPSPSEFQSGGRRRQPKLRSPASKRFVEHIVLILILS